MYRAEFEQKIDMRPFIDLQHSKQISHYTFNIHSALQTLIKLEDKCPIGRFLLALAEGLQSSSLQGGPFRLLTKNDQKQCVTGANETFIVRCVSSFDSILDGEHEKGKLFAATVQVRKDLNCVLWLQLWCRGLAEFSLWCCFHLIEQCWVTIMLQKGGLCDGRKEMSRFCGPQ